MGPAGILAPRRIDGGGSARVEHRILLLSAQLPVFRRQPLRLLQRVVEHGGQALRLPAGMIHLCAQHRGKVQPKKRLQRFSRRRGGLAHQSDRFQPARWLQLGWTARQGGRGGGGWGGEAGACRHAEGRTSMPTAATAFVSAAEPGPPTVGPSCSARSASAARLCCSATPLLLGLAGASTAEPPEVCCSAGTSLPLGGKPLPFCITGLSPAAR